MHCPQSLDLDKPVLEEHFGARRVFFAGEQLIFVLAEKSIIQ